ncbi:hypothetical protein TKK_0012025 [Trichogramma kaykai]|uniref:EndoU domain-containing protein n=1 Tax=Trichogramma kaykai TaxID=54128 RepID=A0ABD2WQ02_9HYME
MKIFWTFFVVLLALSLVVDVDAGWKFWKKKKDNESSSEDPNVISSTTTTTTTTTLKPAAATTNRPNVKAGVAGAADPGLAVGVGSSGDNIRNQPRKPNPGTDVGLDIGLPKAQKPGVGPAGGQGYRDWAADLTGAGNNGPAPKLPSKGPALAPTGTSQGNKPVQAPATSTSTVKPTSPSPSLKITTTVPSSVSTQKPLPATTASPSKGPQPTASWANIAAGGIGKSTPTPLTKPTARPGTGAAVVAGGAAIAAGGAVAAASGAFSSNPTFSKGKTVTDEDLEKLSEALFIKDTNNANKYIKLNLQKSTSGSNPKDEAPLPLLEVKPEALQIPTIQKVLAIYDNYKLDVREHEHINPAQRQEESLLIDTFLSTNVMSYAMRFLADKNFILKDYYAYKDTLRTMWFNLYSRGEGKIGSTGFEHVFLSELKLGSEVLGLHNWIYFNAEEVKKRLDYLGYIKKVDLGDKAAIAKVHLKFNGVDKPVTNIFIGTSPELEMALYTVCFLTRPDTKCPVSLGGTKFNIITHKFKYRGRDLIGSAYPEI